MFCLERFQSIFKKEAPRKSIKLDPEGGHMFIE